MKLKSWCIVLVSSIAIAIFIIPTAYANSPIRPEISITVNGVGNGDIVDILVDENELYDPETHNYDNHQNEIIHEYNKDGYIAFFAHTKNIYKVNSKGNSGRTSSSVKITCDFKHEIPSEYKVIVCTLDGEVSVSETIDFGYEDEVSLVYSQGILTIKEIDTHEAQKKAGNLLFIFIVAIFLGVPLITTLTIEVLMALILKFKKYLAVLLTNLVTNLLMNISLLLLMSTLNIKFWVLLLMAEVVVIAIEFIVYYILYKKEYSFRKILVFTVVANASSCLSSFIYGIFM